MARLQPISQVILPVEQLRAFGQTWIANRGCLSRTPPNSSMQLGFLIDGEVAKALSTMLGNIPIVKPNGDSLLPKEKDCIELGDVRVVGGIRSQNFDVGYRPDGVRIAYDSKTLNDTKSVQKNY